MKHLFCFLVALAAISSWATIPNPFHSGTNVSITVGSTSVTMGNDVLRRVVSFESGLKTTSLQNNDIEMLAAPSTEGLITLNEDIILDLANATVNPEGITVEDAADSKIVKIPTIVGECQVTVCYRIFAGNRPWVSKWFEFPSSINAKSVVLEKLQLKPLDQVGDWGDNGKGYSGMFQDTRLAFGVMLNTLRRTAALTEDTTNCYSNGGFIWARIKTNGNINHTDKVVLVLAKGTKYTAAFGLQLYWSTYLATATLPRPVVYNTWYGYKWYCTEADCLRVIPTAAQIGCDIFVVDDTWQNKYGEWNFDTYDFPNGFDVVSQTARDNGMQFGFWIAPALTATTASNYDYDKVIKLSDGVTPYSPWGGYHVNCFSLDSWRDWFTDKFLSLAQSSQAIFSKLDFTVFRDGCYDANHPHPSGEAQLAQWQSWQQFCSDVRTAIPGFNIYRTGTNCEQTGTNDFGWYSDWLYNLGLNNATPTETTQWYLNSDWQRFASSYVRYLCPPFAMSASAPPHLVNLTEHPDHDNALNYMIASIAAYYCNLEFSGSLDNITPEEVATCQWWVNWFKQNQDFLAYSQFDASTPRCYDPQSQQPSLPDGVFHLRPLLRGKYGFLVFFNPASYQQSVNVSIDPADYFLQIGETQEIFYHALNAGWTVPNTNPTKLEVGWVMPPRSWEIVELRNLTVDIEPAPPVANTTSPIRR